MHQPRLALFCFVGLLLASASAQSQEEAELANPDAAELAERIEVDPAAFVEGNLYFIVYHELGHALVSEFGLAVLGREEDAVDNLATWMMTPDSDAPDPTYLLSAMKGWFLFASEVKLSDIQWWEAHGADQQRGFQIACLLFGSDPAAFKQVADAADLPEDRRETCMFDAQQNAQSWTSVLSEHIHQDGTPETTTAPTVIHNPTEDYAAERRYIEELGLLQGFSDFMHSEFRLAPGMTLQAEECGEANAFWFADTRTITICYELVAAYKNMAAAMPQ